ncbi:MATE family efflux transporter, partial [Leucobacter sp. OLES1]
LGRRDEAAARAVVRRTLLWGVLCGAIVGLVPLVTSPVLGRVLSSDPPVPEILPPALIVLGLSLPLGGLVFVLDGVLMGAGDARYLAWTSLVNLAVYLPVLWLLTVAVPTGTPALIALTAGFTVVFMAARALTLWLRARGGRWIVLGV